MKRLAILVQGAVQGVGFRPFVFRLAESWQLKGWVNNSSQGVTIEIEGESDILQLFLIALEQDKPPRSQIDRITVTELELIGYQDFEIRASSGGEKTVTVLPDLSTCNDCLAEIFDPQNRRYHYPFTNCTNCGPRYSIIEALPYDRPLTTMKGFEMCAVCLAEYNNPRDRRFHAQPNACLDCGPQLEYWDQKGKIGSIGEAALLATIEAIKTGKVLAIKGLGGFHLVVDASNFEAVQKLRDRKQRPHKPLALMYPNLEQIKQDCWVSDQEEALLLSAASPIVLLKRKFDFSESLLEGLNPPQSLLESLNSPQSPLKRLDSPQSPLKRGRNKRLAANIAVDNSYLGVMLPYTPLHHLLLKALDFPIVATSANLSDEPLCTDEQAALTRLNRIADNFLVHNRPIFRPIDDSIVRVIANQTMIIRRAKGYAPYPVKLDNCDAISQPILAVGGHLKNTIAIARQNQVYLSQHIGDLSNALTYQSFLKTIESLANLYDFQPAMIAQDAHPEYRSSQYAQSQPLPSYPIQHHYAHILSVMAEHRLKSPVLGIAWDGTGYGLDGTLWGGEFIQIHDNYWQRIAHFETFPLIGGEMAVKEPRRIALALLKTANLELPQSLKQVFSEDELRLFSQMLNRRLNCPLTSSVGRLFDGIAALVNLYPTVTFEGQAAIALENQAMMQQHLSRQDLGKSNLKENLGESNDVLSYPFTLKSNSKSEPIIIQWQPLLISILQDLKATLPIAKIAAKFHHTLVEIAIAIAHHVGIQQVVLTGGCFQNAYLLEAAVSRLKAENFVPYWPQNVPPNDGGLALGQVLATLRAIKSSQIS
ncbi:MAG: carbamoyltransferase HypF [Snowella sp.]|nr:carbamoyltransferase HypF [Snowella sp.]